MRLLKLVLLALACTSTLSYPCSFISHDGTMFDMHRLRLVGTDYKGHDLNHNYHLNLCDYSTSSQHCIDSHGAACVYDISEAQFLGVLGSDTDQPWPYWHLINPTDPHMGLSLSFYNSHFRQHVVHLRVDLICDRRANSTQHTMQVFANFTANHFVFEFATPYSCPLGHVDGQGGLSPGSVFIIVILSFAVLYVGGGCFVKTCRDGTTGVESCPNVLFWREFWELVLDGVRFVYAKGYQCIFCKPAYAAATYQEV